MRGAGVTEPATVHMLEGKSNRKVSMLRSRPTLMAAMLAGAMALGVTACDDDDLDVEEEETTVVPPADETPTVTEPDATTTEETE